MIEDEQFESDLDAIKARHSKEKKELRGKIVQLKKSVNKDKKKKKEVGEEIEKLEKELQSRHAKEIIDIQGSTCEIEDKMAKIAIVKENLEFSYSSNSHNEKKITKAEKRRQKKAEAEREREIRIKEGERLNQNSERKIETEKLNEKLKERGLQMHEINSDGDCLFAAISHQLESGESVKDLRSLAVDLMRERKDDYAPFLIDQDTGDLLSDEQFDSYCQQMRNSAVWGGQPELRALSQTLKRKIEVLQAEGAPVVFGEEYADQPSILLPYYRHFCELGEHYNSVLPIRTNCDT